MSTKSYWINFIIIPLFFPIINSGCVDFLHNNVGIWCLLHALFCGFDWLEMHTNLNNSVAHCDYLVTDHATEKQDKITMLFFDCLQL